MSHVLGPGNLRDMRNFRYVKEIPSKCHIYFNIGQTKFLTLSENVKCPRLRKFTGQMKFLMHKGNVK